MMGEIFKLMGTIGVDTGAAEKGIDGTTKHAEGAASKITGFFKKAATAIGAVFAAGKIIDFGKMAVEAAAGAKAIEAQFEQVFGDMQDGANQAINKMAAEFDMVPNRLRPGMTKMTSMFKGLGMDTEEAMGKATDAVRLSADAAAFYDVSFENANQSLSSFLKGNYEAGESIGIFANDTQLATFAIEQGVVSAAKEWTALDEATKQATRLEYAKQMQELAGATGQAARESDGYENQMGNLKQAWQDFLTLVGGPVLEPVVAGLMVVTDWLVIAGSKVQEFQGWFSGFIEQIKQTEAWQFIQQAIQLVVDKVQAFIANFQTLKENVTNSAIWDTLKGYLSGLVTFFQGLFSGEGNLANTFMRIFGMIRDAALPILADAIAFIKDIIGQLTAFWQENGQQIVQAVQNAFQFIANIIQFLMPVILAIVTTVWENIKGVFQGALDMIMGAIKIFTGLFTGDWSKMWEGIKQLFGGALEFLWNLWNLIAMGKLLGGIKSFITNGFSALKGFIDDIIAGFKNGGVSISEIFNAVKTTLSNIASTIKNSVSNTFNSLWDTVKTVWDGIKNAIANPINMARDIVSGAIEAIKGFFDFEITWPSIPMPHFSVNPPGWQIGDLVKGSIPSLGIDFYAKGGIMTKARAFGVNGDNLMVGGEAGPEAILPLTRETLGKIGHGIADTMNLKPEHREIAVNLTLQIGEFINQTDQNIEELSELLAFHVKKELEGMGIYV